MERTFGGHTAGMLQKAKAKALAAKRPHLGSTQRKYQYEVTVGALAFAPNATVPPGSVCVLWTRGSEVEVPRLGSCASLGRGSSGGAWRLRAARDIQGERPGHWAPSHCLGCSSQPPRKPPMPLPLAI
mgnify:CR=1 FL=1